MSQFVRGWPRDLAGTRGKVYFRGRFGYVVGYSADAARGRRTFLVIQVVPGLGATVLPVSENDREFSRLRSGTDTRL